MSTRSTRFTSAMRRGIVQFGRSPTGASSNGAHTRNAASVFTGGGPAYTLASMASTPPRAKSPRQKRTVSSRTQNNSPIRALVHPSASTEWRAPGPPRHDHARCGQSFERIDLRLARHHWRFASHAPSSRTTATTESQSIFVGQVRGVWRPLRNRRPGKPKRPLLGVAPGRADDAGDRRRPW